MLAIHALGMFGADLFKSRSRLEAENLFLRHQLTLALRRKRPRIRLRGSDRALLVWMVRLWPSLLDAVHVVQPETILRWHRAGVRALWRWKSRHRAGRPKIDRELRELIRRIISPVADVLHEHLRSGINPGISARIVFPATPGLARGGRPEFPDVASRHRVRRSIQ